MIELHGHTTRRHRAGPKSIPFFPYATFSRLTSVLTGAGTAASETSSTSIQSEAGD
jgi:hypothetical protein